MEGKAHGSEITWAAKRSRCACDGTDPGTLILLYGGLVNVQLLPLKSMTFCEITVGATSSPMKVLNIAMESIVETKTLGDA